MDPNVEYLDVLSETGEFVAKHPRKDVHAHGWWHKVVQMWIINSYAKHDFEQYSSIFKFHTILMKAAILEQMLVEQKTRITHPEKSQFEAGDDPETTCLREAQEEIGITLQKSDLKHVFSGKQQFVLKQGKYIDNEFVEVYLVECDLELTSLKLQEDEVEEVKYLPWKDVYEMWKTSDSSFVPCHSDYEPFWNYLDKHYSS